ncbi:Uncharacterised protein [Budvicia aquatica]|uniref:Uncharacterized protein n=1 Tax=Budvicia aquatica TaxID=82979 RepID=A0A484ZL86_9GAMM|nr:Uncharacterised protein [Budvicia aquatica]
MRIVLLGAPFSGKDIQLEFIAARYGMVKNLDWRFDSV